MVRHNTGDMLSGGLGAKVKGEESSSNPTEETVSPIGHTPHDKIESGTNLLDSEDVKKEEVKDSKVDASQDEDVDLGKTDPDTWTKENSLKEMKKLREEAKSTRLKYQEKLKQKEEEFSSKMTSERKKYEEALQAAKELETLKLKEADKKRSLEERLAHREKVIEESEARMKAIEDDYLNKLEAADNRIKELEARQEAQNQVYKERLTEELSSISEEKRDIANLIVKGAGDDPRDQLIALNEARIKGFFDEKKVVVNHSVPGANNGARVSQKQLQEQEAERRKSMSSQDKIREGLRAVGRASASKTGKNSII